MTERPPFDVRIHRDGREVCQRTPNGRAIYRQRTLEMRQRQEGRCCLEFYAPMCPGALRADEATFEHEHGRGGGKRDDRIEVTDPNNPEKTIWINGAAHSSCNSWKGSRYIDYNRSFQK